MRNAARGKPKPESSRCRDSMYARRRDAGSVRKHFRTGTEKPRDEFARNLAIFMPRRYQGKIVQESEQKSYLNLNHLKVTCCSKGEDTKQKITDLIRLSLDSMPLETSSRYEIENIYLKKSASEYTKIP